MPEATKADLARIRAAVRFRDGCVRAALEHYRRTDLRPIDTYARAAFDGMEALIRADERRRLRDVLAPLLEESRFAEEITHASGCDRAHAAGLAAEARKVLGWTDSEGADHG